MAWHDLGLGLRISRFRMWLRRNEKTNELAKDFLFYKGLFAHKFQKTTLHPKGKGAVMAGNADI